LLEFVDADADAHPAKSGQSIALCSANTFHCAATVAFVDAFGKYTAAFGLCIGRWSRNRSCRANSAFNRGHRVH
jgi:hypothetical protein